MDPQKQNMLPPVQPPQRQGGRSYVGQPPSRDPQERQKSATVNLVRSQIDAIYDGRDPGSIATPANQRPTQPAATQKPASTPQPHSDAAQIKPQAAAPQAPQQTTDIPRQKQVTNNQPIAAQPQQSTDSPSQAPQQIVQKQPAADMSKTRSQPTVNAAEWQKYHSAWQDYYRKYYEQYYTQQLTSAKQSAATTVRDNQAPKNPSQKVAHEDEQDKRESAARKKAVEELKSKLLTKVETSAKKARKSRHFIPLAAALVVVLVFGFLQYNQILIANVKAYVTPGSIDPANIIVEPESTIEVGPESRLIIPKINVDTPVFYDIPSDKASQDKAMANGVAHFAVPGASSHPGQVGNTVLSGHSSNDVFAQGDYKYIFMQLDKLAKGDIIYANYKGTRYTYRVTNTKEVAPTNVKALVYKTDTPEITLITCTPLGTDLRRLLVTAEQIYPTDTKPAPQDDASDKDDKPATIPGENAPSVLSRLFGS